MALITAHDKDDDDDDDECAWKDITEKQIFLPSFRAQTDETSSHLGNSGPRCTLF